MLQAALASKGEVAARESELAAFEAAADDVEAAEFEAESARLAAAVAAADSAEAAEQKRADEVRAAFSSLLYSMLQGDHVAASRSYSLTGLCRACLRLLHGSEH
jgi:hypothetical protein